MVKPELFSTWFYPTEVRFGVGRISEICEACSALNVERPLIVTDVGLAGSEMIKEIIDLIKASSPEVGLFSKVQGNPVGANIEEGTAAFRSGSHDGVIAIGGGSAMDAGKVIAMYQGQEKKLFDLHVKVEGGPDISIDSIVPIIAVPTTAGTGSEVTPISIITTGENEKKGVVSDLLYPDYAILDASLTTSLPTFISASTGIDAMVHAIEAQTSVHKKNSLSDMLSREALNLLGKNIYRVCENGDDLEARQNMLLGSMLAGQAFANAPVAAVHALAYPIGTHFKVSHGVSNVLMLPHVLRFNARNAWASDIYDSIVPLCFPDLQDTNANFHDEGADIMSTRFLQMTKDFEIPGRLKDVNIEYSDCEMLATEAMKQTRLLPNNPRLVEFDDAFNLYVDAL